MKTVAVIIPAHNEAKTIGYVINGCKKYVKDIVVIDDGSTDNTGMVAKAYGASVIRCKHNRGYGASLKVGFIRTREYNTVITMDADGQHNPDDIPLLLKKIDDGYDMVIGSRFLKKDHVKGAWYNRMGRWFIGLISNAGYPILTDPVSGYRAFGSLRLDWLEIEDNGFGATAEILIKARKAKFKIGEVPVTCNSYILGADTHFNIFGGGLRMIVHALKWRIKTWD